MNNLDDAKSFLEERAEELNFAKSMDRNEMYKLLMSYGNELAEFPKEFLIEENFVKGCTSNVYIHSILIDDKVIYLGKSDALIVKGYLSLLITALSGLSPEDVLKTEEIVNDFVKNTDVKASLTPSRANAFGNIYKMMKDKAEELINK